ncbi:hypothetical protein TSUD_367870 [Trifolium subterraneum]|uniref:Endonuclease/exonuclease/phosphatase domain-containing protein n=1 Tax=Trifolium subterraneum TaxID=3900 RepID=A0A2Z6LI54_TRISU|nr:hypothetical protein TSUD_367870 [Trifolium subterraneum]
MRSRRDEEQHDKAANEQSLAGTLPFPYKEASKSFAQAVKTAKLSRQTGAQSIVLSYEAAKEDMKKLQKEIRSWCPSDLDVERTIWLRIYGVPSHAWNESFFTQLVKPWGSFINEDEGTLKKSTMDVTHLMICTSCQQIIDEIVDVKVNDVVYHLRVLEDSYGPMRIVIPQKNGNEGRDSSVESEEDEEGCRRRGTLRRENQRRKGEISRSVEEVRSKEDSRLVDGGIMLGQEDGAGGQQNSTTNHHNIKVGVLRRLTQSDNMGCVTKPNRPKDTVSGGEVEQVGGVYSDGPRNVYLKLNKIPAHIDTTLLSKGMQVKNSKSVKRVNPIPTAVLKKQQIINNLNLMVPNPDVSLQATISASSKMGDLSRNSKKLDEGVDIRNCNKRFVEVYELDKASTIWLEATELGVEGDEEEERGSMAKRRRLSSLIKTGAFDMCMLQETKRDNFDDYMIHNLWGHTDVEWVAKKSNGLSGGLLSVWNKDLFSFRYSFTGDGFLGVCVEWKAGLLYIVNVYSSCNISGKRKLWTNLIDFKLNNEPGEWCLGGDFNSISKVGERRGSSSGAWRQGERIEFIQFIDALEVVDIPLKGKMFTRFNSDGSAMSRLDRFLVSEGFIEKGSLSYQWFGDRYI